MSKSSLNQGEIYFQRLKKAIVIVKSNVQGTNIRNVKNRSERYSGSGVLKIKS